jgi:DNA replication protein
MANFPGFLDVTRSVPVPSTLLGPLLEEITDMAELKCTLRFLWYLAQVKVRPRTVQASALREDEVLLTALGSAEAVSRGLGLAVERGTLLLASSSDGMGGASEAVYLLHTPENKRLAESLGPPPHQVGFRAGERRPAEQRFNIFTLYEENIGVLTPLVADGLRAAETSYPGKWIEDAFREAVEHNKRSWRYISAILERWSTEGRGRGADGEFRRHTETLTAAEYLHKYGLPDIHRNRSG